MKAFRKFSVLLLGFVFSAACAQPGRAATIYSNIQPGDTFGPGVGIGLIPFNGVFNYAGVGFAAGQTYTFESMELAASLFSGPNVLDVYLMSSLGGLPNQLLESFELDNELSTDSSTGLVAIESVTHPMLMAGQVYWVVAAGGSATFATWQQNVHNVQGLNVSGPALTSLVRDSDANIVEAIEVDGTAVPEPGSWMFTAGALLLGLAYSYRSATRGSTRAALRAGK